MHTRIINYNEARQEEWDAFVRENSGGYAYHLYDVIALDRWENDKNHSFAIYDDDKKEIVMIAQLHIEDRFRMVDGEKMERVAPRIHSRWGFVYKDGLGRKEFNKLSKSYVAYIDSLYEQYHFSNRLDTAMPPLTERLQPQNGLTVNPFIEFGFQPEIRYTYIVDLKKNDEQVLEDCEQTTRQAIRKILGGKRYKVEREVWHQKKILINM